MRIGYPCINRSIGCTPVKTFRLASYSDQQLKETIKANLACIRIILSYNAENGLLIFRITSDIVPFVSHPVGTFPWQEHFAGELGSIREWIRSRQFRISLHPDQFVLLNAPDPGVLQLRIASLSCKGKILDMMVLGRSAKLQIQEYGWLKGSGIKVKSLFNPGI
jgi:UV DNA damage endonuclease